MHQSCHCQFQSGTCTFLVWFKMPCSYHMAFKNKDILSCTNTIKNLVIYPLHTFINVEQILQYLWGNFQHSCSCQWNLTHLSLTEVQIQLCFLDYSLAGDTAPVLRVQRSYIPLEQFEDRHILNRWFDLFQYALRHKWFYGIPRYSMGREPNLHLFRHFENEFLAS